MELKVLQADQAVYKRLDRLSIILRSNRNRQKDRVFRYLHQAIVAFAAKGSYLMVFLVLMQCFSVLMYPLLACLGAFFARIVNGVIRKCINRPRPHVRLGQIPFLYHKPTSSFPSNHAAGGFALTVGIWNASPTLGVLMLILAGFLSFSRLYVKLHYLTDVLAGAVVGAGTSYLLLSIFSQVHL